MSEFERFGGVKINGVSIETDDAHAFADIGALWAKAGAAGVLRGAEAWAIYDRYSVNGGGYRVRVTVGGAAPDGMVVAPAQKVWHLVTDGSIEALRDAWARVWKRWPDGGARAFVADVERWEMGEDGAPKRAEIFVGVRD
jgi:predicted transcriptional regulator YdeE